MPSPLEAAQFAAGSLRRRWRIALAVSLVVFAMAALYYRVSPPRYRIQAKILSQRPSAAMGGGSAGDDSGARSAWDLVHRRDNLVALIQEAKVLQGGVVDPGRGIATRLLDLLRPPEVERKEEPIDLMVRILDKRLTVNAEGDTIEFRLDWPEPVSGYLIVRGALQNFLEARHLHEVGALDDVIAQMEGRAARLKSELDAAIASSSSSRRPLSPHRAAAPRPRQASEELVRLRSLVEAKARAANDVEEFRSRRLSELESQLTQARATLSELHPTVVGLRRDIEALSHESSQLRALRDEERKLRAEYAARVTAEGVAPEAVGVPDPPVAVDLGAAREEDPRVRDLRSQYEQVIGRVTSARVELDAARAAFKYRYNVVWPPEIPTELYSPKPALVLGGGLLLAILLGVVAAIVPDLLSGRILQRWQIERDLGITVLGEVPSSRRTPR